MFNHPVVCYQFITETNHNQISLCNLFHNLPITAACRYKCLLFNFVRYIRRKALYWKSFIVLFVRLFVGQFSSTDNLTIEKPGLKDFKFFMNELIEIRFSGGIVSGHKNTIV